LPRLDDLDRIIKNTPNELKSNALFEWIVSMQSKLIEDLDKMWVKSFDSKGEEVNPDKHDVMTTVPGQKEWIIFDEFEKWYVLWDKVLRHAKVVVWAGE
jgi:molecular chaperone GrpE